MSKVCSSCNTEKPYNDFHKAPNKDGYNGRCKVCISAYKKKHYKDNVEELRAKKKEYWKEVKETVNFERRESRRANPLKSLLAGAKQRAKRKGVSFEIDESHLNIPDTCPLLGIPIRVGEGAHTPNSPSIDRIVPELGYVPGNVWVISYKANTIKNDASLEQLEKIVSGLKNILGV